MINWSSDDDDFTEASNQDYREYKNWLKNPKTTQGFENYFKTRVPLEN